MSTATIPLPHNATLVVTKGNAAVTAADELAAATSRRVYVAVQNLSTTAAESIHIAFGAEATATDVKLTSGQMWESPAHYCPQGALSVISESGTPAIVIWSATDGS